MEKANKEKIIKSVESQIDRLFEPILENCRKNKKK